MAAVVLLATLATIAHAQDGFTITNGQIFTNGLVIVDSPQPNTPMGGGELLAYLCPVCMKCTAIQRLWVSS
jgi:hypothetical protein